MARGERARGLLPCMRAGVIRGRGLEARECRCGWTSLDFHRAPLSDSDSDSEWDWMDLGGTVEVAS